MRSTGAFEAGRRLGALLAKVAGDANALEKAFGDVSAREPGDLDKKDPINEDAMTGRSADKKILSWGPEQATDSKNDLSTWGGFDTVSRY